MVDKGESSPEIKLPGIENGAVDTYDLRDVTGHGKAILILFYPFDFSPVCTNELCAIRDAEWFELTSDLEVWAISSDSVHAHRAFAEKHDLNFPLLSDSHGSVAASYDLCYDQWEGHEHVPQRGVVLVDDDNTIRYVWQTDDAYEKPDFFPVKEAIDQLTADQDTAAPTETDISVEYDEGPGKVR